MKGFLNFFARWVVPVLGLLALSLIIWFLGPLLRLGNYEPLASATSRWVLIVLLFLVWIGFRVLRIVQARRNAAKVMQSLAEVSAPDAASVATAEELATLKQRMDEALALLKRAKLGGSERRNLYELPWYVIIGPPGSGKTTALMNSGLDFPLAAQMGAGAIRGVGGTRNCDWWFTDEAVLLDTAGRYTTQDSHAQVDKAAWLGFLDLLKTQRKRRPIDGAFIAISLSDLLLGSDAERAAHAQAIRARIQELYQQLGVRFPIYVMLTKFDLVPGFMEFFDSLNREERAQVWGMTFALDDGKSAEGPLAVFDSEFALLEQRLTARLVERLQQERDPARRDLVYGFPQQFAALRECLGEFLNGVFKPNPYEERPLLRGLYFTSGTQEGSPIDRLIGSMAQSMNLDRQHLARQTGTGRSYFIERLFREVAFGERGLVGTNPKVERRRKWLTIGALSATALVVLAVTAVWIASYRANQSYIAAVDQRVDPLARGIESLSPAQRDVLAVLPQLNAVQNLAGDAPSWAEGYGLYQGDMLGEESASVYRKLLIAVFAPRLVTRIEEQLRSGGSSDFLYEGLKAYLMLGSPDHYDADFIKAWISLDWERNLPRDLSPEQRQALHARLAELQAQLSALQGEEPLILPTVDYQAVASVVADWTGIPVGRMARNEIETVLNLDQHLKKRIIGQDHALEMIAKRIQTSRAGLDNPSKPIGVFMLAGTSGVGKTETALALAEAMYGGEQNVITINMSEFQEAHTVSTLKGAPPGYIGYGEGGVLTEAVRRKPYSVVLLDEVEKAHPDVHEIFFQVFDKGVMEDGEGRVIDFKNTLILLTTNAGTEMIASLCADPELMPEPEAIAKSLREPLLKIFPPALLGRLVTIPYYPLSDDMLKAISRLQLGRIKKRVEATHKVPFEFDEGVVDLIVSRCTETESGGRMIDAILTNTLLPDMSREFLTRMLEGKPLAGVRISSRDNQFHYDFAEAE
ncbi:type VI secretion system membrane subunit TssM [Pseudomonas aeruginosa]|nr:type VI secretion system membrane subunit TssM [Pseudomonas aeruginosa]